MASDVAIRSAAAGDAAPIAAIYNHYVARTVVTFEEEPVSEAAMAERIRMLLGRHPWLVAEADGALAGYAYARPWHERSAYRLSVESTIYLDAALTGRGIGTALYGALLADLRDRGLHCAIGGIALPNAASVALHERLGFRPAGVLHEVGFKLGRWVDVGYWELLL